MTLREHLQQFTPDMSDYEKLAQDAIALANRGHWTTLLVVDHTGTEATVAQVIEDLRLGDFLAPKHDAWAPL